jgi:hypothetical protein
MLPISLRPPMTTATPNRPGPKAPPAPPAAPIPSPDTAKLAALRAGVEAIVQMSAVDAAAEPTAEGLLLKEIHALAEELLA